MNVRFTFIMLFLATGMFAQQVQDFEGFEMPASVDTFINNAGGGDFLVGDISLSNAYNAEWGSWGGFAISNDTDTETSGYTNQYSVISGSGVDGSSTYAVSYAYSGSYMTIAEGKTFKGFSINNSTYAYLSIQDGDDYAKKFGGETGNDPDFFMLTIKGYNGGEYLDSLNFYLADYRFEDNSQDYIVSEWTEVMFPESMAADSLTFSLSSSDNSQYGINQPAYFCVDNIVTETVTVSTENQEELEGVKLVNTLATDLLTIESNLEQEANYVMVNANGQILANGSLNYGSNALNVANLARGMYWIEIIQNGQRSVQNFVKQ